MEKKKIYVYGYYGFSNFGDDLLALSVIKGIFQKFPQAEVWIRSFEKIPALDEFGDRLNYSSIEKIAIDQTLPKLKRGYLYFSTLWNQLKNTDFFILGGGNLHDDREARFATFLLLVVCILAKARGARLIGLGLGVGRMSTSLGKILLFLNFNLFDFLSIRDPLGIEECKKARVFRKVHLTSDVAFSLPQNFKERSKGTPPRIETVGFSLVGYLFDDIEWESKPESAQFKMFHAIFDLIATLYKDGKRAVLLSFQNMRQPNGQAFGDHAILEKMQKDLQIQFRIQVPIEDCLATNSRIRRSFEPLDLYVGGRFHGFVIAAAHGIPMVGISHDHKVRELCREFEMPWVDMEVIDSAWLKKHVIEGSVPAPNKDTLTRVQKAARACFDEAFH